MGNEDTKFWAMTQRGGDECGRKEGRTIESTVMSLQLIHFLEHIQVLVPAWKQLMSVFKTKK
jgi:hypothetical protein